MVFKGNYLERQTVENWYYVQFLLFVIEIILLKVAFHLEEINFLKN